MKFSVVPDSSERLTGVISVDGRSASGLSAAIAGSSQVVIFWLKIPAIVPGVRLSVVDARQVEGDRDGADVERQLDDDRRRRSAPRPGQLLVA